MGHRVHYARSNDAPRDADPAMLKRVILWTMSALAVAGFVLTVDRVPLTEGDGAFYASIARSLQLRGVGIPTVLKDAPTAVDHVPFYGPVFFRLVAVVFTVFGFSMTTLRSVAIAGALLIAAPRLPA